MNAISKITKFSLSLLLVGTLVPTNVFAKDSDVLINEQNFPDPTFRGIVENLVGADDGVFTPSEIANIKQIYCDTTKVNSVKGLEFFTEITKLKVNNTKITDLDLSHNTKLVDVECTRNDIKTLNVSKNPNMKTLYCEGNQIETLDLSNNPKLEIVYCRTNKLKNLDVSNKTKLLKLDCGQNDLVNVDVTGATKLTHLWAHENNLKQIDVSTNKNLSVLWCNNNPELSSVNVGNNPALTALTCNDANISTLDLSNNPKLQYLKCHGNELTELDLSNNPKLIQLQCSNNELTELNLEKNTALTDVLCYFNNLTSLDLTKQSNLKVLNCSNNHIDALNLDGKTSLKEVDCSNNEVTILSVNKDKLLREILCSNNHIKTLNVTDNTNLYTFDCTTNELTSLDLSKNTQLNTFYCSYNQFASLDLSKNKNLKHYEFVGNERSVEDGTALSELPGFDQSKASNIVGGNFDNGTVNFTDDQIRYTYDCGNNKSETFTLTKSAKEFIKPVSINATLTDRVGMNIYLDVLPEAFEDENSYIEVTVKDGDTFNTTKYTPSEFKTFDDLYYITIDLAARQMSDVCTLTIYGTLEDGSAGALATHTYTVQGYGEKVLKQADLTLEEKAMVESMLNYGAMSQLYFDYATDRLANANIENDDYLNVTAQDLADYETVVDGSVAGIEYGASNLRLLSTVALRHHFVVNDDFKRGYDEGKISMMYQAKEDYLPLQVEFYDGNKVYGEYASIYPTEFGQTINVVVKNDETQEQMKVESSVNAYLKQALLKSKNEKLVQLAKSMVVYGQSATAYLAATK